MGKIGPVATPRFLFVYGTLMKGFDSLQNWQRRVQAEFVGRGKIKGRLYDLGEYPVVISSVSEQLVRGEVYELRDPANAVDILDEYEEFSPLHPERSLFVRAVTPVVMDDGREMEAWVYFYNGPVDEDNLIPGGDYGGRANLPSAGTRRVR
ncbi:MAG: gamma-glutamylcyclotransferase [Acidobacteria bacterium]|nr:gamma-glutamylcyclotransferase [Acidobacteriota bacterium]